MKKWWSNILDMHARINTYKFDTSSITLVRVMESSAWIQSASSLIDPNMHWTGPAATYPKSHTYEHTTSWSTIPLQFFETRCSLNNSLESQGSGAQNVSGKLDSMISKPWSCESLPQRIRWSGCSIEYPKSHVTLQISWPTHCICVTPLLLEPWSCCNISSWSDLVESNTHDWSTCVRDVGVSSVDYSIRVCILQAFIFFLSSITSDNKN